MAVGLVVVEMGVAVMGMERVRTVVLREAMPVMAVAATAEAEMKVEGADTLAIRWE